MIKGVNGINKEDGAMELKRTFHEHYRIDHPTVTRNSFTTLVDDHSIKFVTENEKNRLSPCKSLLTRSNIGTLSSIFKCNLCIKEFPSQDSLSHWNIKHMSIDLNMLSYTDVSNNVDVSVEHLYDYVGQCSTCSHY